ncbi:PLC-like phosphodiesterases superfamily protein, putative [Theobroma cacao]|uniref:glycerophosphodiester phosphodiesterase n=1 Tax=Theobroma cacao TaxID=3641 RepID=A0A061E534_THECC|nr:PLC-like phosphodiesterases superfamily protein, putative [Theobroma cacao]
MALKVVHVSDVPHLDQVPENAALALCSTRFSTAAQFPVDFIEFDIQGVIVEKGVTEVPLAEFLSYGPQKELGKEESIFRKTKDGRIFEWKVEKDAPLCTLEEVFRNVDQSLGLNIELKFDDQIVYKEEELSRILQAILKVVFENAKDRLVMFSSFQPDAAQLVFSLTNGGCEIYTDIRRNSLDEAIKLCLASGLHGIVSEVKATFRSPEAVARIEESKLSLITYGQLK